MDKGCMDSATQWGLQTELSVCNCQNWNSDASSSSLEAVAFFAVTLCYL
jgi:hypothetical protein